MSYLKLNFYEIISSYLICKASEDFLNNVGGQYDSSDLSLISSLVNGFKRFNFDLSCPFRFKTYMAYLISIFARYFSKQDEESLHEILQTLFNQKAEIIIPLHLLKSFKRVVCKKVLNLMESNSIHTYNQEFSRILDKNIENLLKPIDIQNTKAMYTNDQFYQEICSILKKYVYAENFSILLELTKSISINDQNEEIELINHFSSYKRVKLLKSNHKKRKNHKRKSRHSDESSSEYDPSEGDMSPDEDLNMALRKKKARQLAKEKEPSEDLRSSLNKQHQALAETSNFEASLTISADLEDVLFETNKNSQFLTQPSFDAIQSTLSAKDPGSKENAGMSIEVDALLNNPSFDETADAVIMETANQIETSQAQNITRPAPTSQTIPATNQAPATLPAGEKPKKKRGRKRKLLPNGELPPKKIRKKIKSTPKHFWSETETFYLVVGVELYGRGKWSKILKEFHKKFKNRTYVNLKDKYRNLERVPEELAKYESRARELIDKANKKYNIS